MSQTQGVTVHPNRVFVRELPLDMDRDELKSAFAGFGLGIRTARVVETNGSTNYGFLTFDSKDEADEVIQRAKSDRGIIIRGKKATVDHAYSRRNPPRRNSRQFSQAFQGLCRSMNGGTEAGMDQQEHLMRQNYNYQYAMSASPDQRCASPANQMHYPVQTSQHYNNLCYDGRNNVYYASPNPGMAAQPAPPGVGQNSHVSFQHGAQHDDARSSTHWPALAGHHYAYETTEHPHQRYGNSYVTAHHPAANGQLYVENPAEGMEAPNMSEWSSHTESATVQRAESDTPTTFHHQNQNLSAQVQSQIHHQTQLQQHFAHQQNLLNAPWYQYAQYQQPHSPRRDSDSSNN